MALQGTLETFALPDVLRLLASTKKTGCYRLEGDRGSGRLFVRDGQIVAGDVASSPSVSDPNEVAFEMLRFVDGEFRFQADAIPPHETAPQDVESVLDAADRMLMEWRDIETIVPSLNTWVGLRAELPADEVSIRADKWVTLVAVGSGCTVGQLGGVLGLGELPVSRLVRDLLDLGVVELHEAPVSTGAEAYASPAAPYQQPYAEEYDPQSYSNESYEEPGFRPGSYEPAYEEPSYEEPAYEQPAYEQQPPYEQPSYEQPGYDQGYEQQPGYEQPQPGYEQPQPGYEQQQPGYEQQPAAGYDQGGYGNQGYDEGSYDDPRYATAAYDPAGQTSLESSMEYGYGDRGNDGNVIEFSPYGENGNGGYDNGSYETFDSGALVMDDSRGAEAGYVEDRYATNPPPPPTRTTSYEPTVYETDPTDAAEIARQLANLSPRAAKAVAAAAKATTQAEREAALAQVDESEDSINRDLLLKFLGSVNS